MILIILENIQDRLLSICEVVGEDFNWTMGWAQELSSWEFKWLCSCRRESSRSSGNCNTSSSICNFIPSFFSNHELSGNHLNKCAVKIWRVTFKYDSNSCFFNSFQGFDLYHCFVGRVSRDIVGSHFLPFLFSSIVNHISEVYCVIVTFN